MTPLLATMMRISVLVLAALLACALLRRRSAAMRHWLLAASLACAALTPALQLIVPAWSFDRGDSTAAPAARSVAVASAKPRVAPVTPGSRGTALATSRLAASSGGARARPRQWLIRALLATWFAGLAVGIAVLAAGLRRLSQVAVAARRADDDWAPLVAPLAQRFGIRRPVAVLESDQPSLLVTWGWRRPKILVPRSAREWSDERLGAVFAHELAHVQRGDWIVQIGADLLRAALWFNPLVWIACRRLRQESEHACDDAVLALGVAPPVYATHLLDVARSFSLHRRTWLPAPAIARPSSLERRVRAMLNSGTNRTPPTRAGRIAATLAVLTIAAAVAGLAQGGATLSGTVRDQSGGLLPGLSVTLELQDAQRQRVAVSAGTDRAGFYEFSGLPNGRYLLQAQLPGFSTYTEALTLSPGQNLQKDLTLSLGEIMETITVTGERSEPRPVDPRIEQLRSGRGAAPTAAPALAPNGIGGNVKAPRKIHDVRPEYPAAALANGVGGNVRLRGAIDVNGFIKDLQVTESRDGDLARAAADAVRQWEFTATQLNGQPVDTGISVLVQFDPRR